MTSTSIEAKRQRIERLLTDLSTDLSNHHLSSQDKLAFISELKVYGRDPTGSEAIYTMKGITTLGRCVFESVSKTTESALEALRCLANALLLIESTRKVYITAGFVKPTVDLLNDTIPDHEFLASRILLFLTYEASLNLEDIISGTHIQKSISQILRRHAAIFSTNGTRAPSVLDDMALVDVLKLVFNVTHHVSEKGAFRESLESILFLLRDRPASEQSLQSPISFLVNAALSIEFIPDDPVAYPAKDKAMNVRRLIDILDKSLAETTERLKNFEENGAPLIQLIKKFHSFAPGEVKDYMKDSLLPSQSERDQPLGRGGSLAARLLRLSSSVVGHIGPLSGSLLYDLSSNDADEFVRNVGFGYASGFLASNGIPFPSTNSNAPENTTGRPSNPVTGQALDAESPQEDPFAGATEEEREREAERLFVLFERLRATGVVDIQNPIRQAVESGRFQEINDSSDSDD